MISNDFRCFPMFSAVFRCFPTVFRRCFLTAEILFNMHRCSQIFTDVFRWSQMFFDDPQLFDDLQLFDDQLEVWTLIIQNSTVIRPSSMVLFACILIIPHSRNFFFTSKLSSKMASCKWSSASYIWSSVTPVPLITSPRIQIQSRGPF